MKMERIELSTFKDVPELCDFSGSFSFPAHPTGRIFDAWWAAMKDSGERTKEDDLVMYQAWRGAYALISQWGEWGIDEIPVGDLSAGGENVPISILYLVGEAVDIHMSKRANVKNSVRLLLNTTTTADTQTSD
jgi:hypothetical protein